MMKRLLKNWANAFKNSLHKDFKAMHLCLKGDYRTASGTSSNSGVS